MNRIYQGKVTQVEIPDPDTKGKEWLLFHRDLERARDLTKRIPELRQKVKREMEERARLSKEQRKQAPKSKDLEKFELLRTEQREQWQTSLWKHHELFQDAVNYYLVAFAAMVDPRSATDGLREFRGAVVRSWEKDIHSDGSYQMRVLGSTLSGRPAWKVFEKRIFSMTSSKASAEQRAAAVEAVFGDPTKIADDMEDAGATLEDKLRGRGRALFPKLKLLCGRVTGTTPDDVRFAQEKLARRAATRVERKGKLTWKDVFAFKTSTERRPWTREQAIKCTKEAFDDVATELAERVKAARQREANRPPNNPAVARQQTGPTAADLNKLYGRFKEMEEAFSKLLASPAFKPLADEPLRAGRGGFEMKAAMVLASHPINPVFRDVFLFFNRRYLESAAPKGNAGPDAVYEARHAGGVERRVFPFFCDLWMGRLDDPSVGLGIWPDFEKQAFIEVFNKVGQFIVTTKRFELRLIEADKIIAESKAQLEVDERLQRVKGAVKTLGGFDPIGNVRPYTIRERTLKGWPKVRQAWRDVLKTATESVTAAALVAEKNRLQTRLRARFGSAPLFDLLAQEHYRMIWRGDDEADPLKTWSRYAAALEEKEHLEEERAFTPAHTLNSPRFFRWSETENKTHLSWKGDDKPFVVQVDALDFDNKSRTQFRIIYRAPRLLRDGLRKAGESIDNEHPDAEWLSPALRPVCKKYGFTIDRQSFERVAVRLAPGNPKNIQLVFEPEIVTDELGRQWREKFPFQAYSTKDEEEGDWTARGLKWPKTEDGLKALQQKPVLGLMVDLGINNAAAYHVLRLESDSERSSNGLIHYAGPDESKPKWMIRSIENGLIRVMGENRWVWRKMTQEEKTNLLSETAKPKEKRNALCRRFCKLNREIKLAQATHAFLPELSGFAGRNPLESPDETKEAANIFEALRSDVDKRIPNWRKLLSFPRQNDELLWALKHVRSQLFRLNRWAEQLRNDAPEKSREAALENVRNLKTHDPLHALSKHVENLHELRKVIVGLAIERTNDLRKFLPVVANRVLPSHRGTWVWRKRDDGWHEMALDENQKRPDTLLAGQRGLSMARLFQLRDLRQLAQSLNHLCRHCPGERRYVIADRDTVPEPFEGCRQTLEDAREDRAKQIAHDIFALAVGVELIAPRADKEKRKHSESLHGVYRCLERGPVNFIALEDLSEYRTSGTRGRRENRQLASWSHRRIHKILTELCEPIGLRIGSRVDLPIVYVKPDLTSRFSAKDHSAGFRAEEVSKDDPRRMFWERQVAEDPDCGWTEVLRLFDKLPEGKTLLIPRKGGQIFVSLGEFNPDKPDASLFHADLSAAYRVGLRALAHPHRRELFGTVNLLPTKSRGKKQAAKNGGEPKRRQFLVDVVKVLPWSVSRPDFGYQVVFRSEAVWDKVDSDLAWQHCRKINLARFGKWKIALSQEKSLPSGLPPDDDDDIPI